MAGDGAFGRRVGAEPGAIHFLLEGLPKVTLVRSILRAWSFSLELSSGATPGSAAVGAVHAHYSTWPVMGPLDAASVRSLVQ